MGPSIRQKNALAGFPEYGSWKCTRWQYWYEWQWVNKLKSLLDVFEWRPWTFPPESVERFAKLTEAVVDFDWSHSGVDWTKTEGGSWVNMTQCTVNFEIRFEAKKPWQLGPVFRMNHNDASQLQSPNMSNFPDNTIRTLGLVSGQCQPPTLIFTLMPNPIKAVWLYVLLASPWRDHRSGAHLFCHLWKVWFQFPQTKPVPPSIQRG
jgi:hypothetical protein